MLVCSGPASAMTPPPVQDADGELLATLLDEYLRSLEAGAPIRLEDLAGQHPHIAEQLASLGEGIATIHRATQHFGTNEADGSASGSVPPKQLGDFRLEREIGRGGMGVVYEAHQISLGRTVALKVLPFAAVWDAKQVARFQNEARAAAQLNHPNIVPVFAVGEEQGVHFYAMQYIAGQSLDVRLARGKAHAKATMEAGLTKAACDTSVVRIAQPDACFRDGEAAAETECERRSGNWSIGRDGCRDIARLGADVAEALHHAHECGVIHRDVKPSNLLRDEHGKAWVADFGLARFQASVSVTMTGDVVGTLRYMSPEQAAGRQAEVDARTDVYGLGATLYELLAGQPAFPADDRQQLLHDITSRDPVPLRTLNPGVPRDLETIVHHSLAKSREDRYFSAHDMAIDLERFLEGRPPLAQRPSLLDHVQKWLFRHRAVATVAVVFMVLLTIVSGAGVLLLARESRAKQAALALAEENLDQAQRNLHQAQEVVDRFGAQLSELLRLYPGMESLRLELLAETARYYEQLAVQAGDSSDLQDRVIDASLWAANATATVGRSQDAIKGYRRALQLLESQAALSPDSLEWDRRIGVVHNNLAMVLADAGQMEAAAAEIGRADVIFARLQAENPRESSLFAQRADVQCNRSMIAAKQGRLDEAQAAMREAVAMRIQQDGEVPRDPEAAHRLALLMSNLSYLQRKADLPAAVQSAGHAVRLLAGIVHERDSPLGYQADLALSRANLATLLMDRGDSDGASAHFDAAIAMQESLVAQEPAVAANSLNLIASLTSLAELKQRQTDLQSAAQSFEKARRVCTKLISLYPSEPAYRSGLAAVLNNAALMFSKAGKCDKAEPIFADAETAQEQVVQVIADSRAKTSLARIYINHRKTLCQLQEWDKAIAVADKLRTLWELSGTDLHRVALEYLALSERAPDSYQKKLRRAVADTLREALDAGYAPPTALAADEQLARILTWPDIQDLKERWGP